jgi:hypothetical protein
MDTDPRLLTPARSLGRRTAVPAKRRREALAAFPKRREENLATFARVSAEQWKKATCAQCVDISRSTDSSP